MLLFNFVAAKKSVDDQLNVILVLGFIAIKQVFGIVAIIEPSDSRVNAVPDKNQTGVCHPLTSRLGRAVRFS